MTGKLIDDPLGLALRDYLEMGRADGLFVEAQAKLMPQPVADFFAADPRDLFEELALQACYGRVLDVGAGAGRHSLLLQEQGHEVLAVDRSPGAISVMAERGVRRVECADILSFCRDSEERFDTILLLNNGLGILGTSSALSEFLRISGRILKPGGRVVTDCQQPRRCSRFSIRSLVQLSQRLLRQRREPPVLLPGDFLERQIRIKYKNARTPEFPWLEVRSEALLRLGEAHGWHVECLHDHPGRFLAQLRKMEDK